MILAKRPRSDNKECSRFFLSTSGQPCRAGQLKVATAAFKLAAREYECKNTGLRGRLNKRRKQGKAPDRKVRNARSRQFDAARHRQVARMDPAPGRERAWRTSRSAAFPCFLTRTAVRGPSSRRKRRSGAPPTRAKNNGGEQGKQKREMCGERDTLQCPALTARAQTYQHTYRRGPVSRLHSGANLKERKKKKKKSLYRYAYLRIKSVVRNLGSGRSTRHARVPNDKIDSKHEA